MRKMNVSFEPVLLIRSTWADDQIEDRISAMWQGEFRQCSGNGHWRRKN